jgi:hypothetical protein
MTEEASVNVEKNIVLRHALFQDFLLSREMMQPIRFVLKLK